jgi:hypothetical protein
MSRDSVRLAPNIPPVGLREVAETCILCASNLESVAVRYPLRLKLNQEGRVLPAVLVGYACRTCHQDRRPEVHAAQFLAAHRYLHFEKRMT